MFSPPTDGLLSGAMGYNLAKDFDAVMRLTL